MAERRAELLRTLREYEACRRAEADRLVLDARHRAERQLAYRLNLVRTLFLRTSALLDADPDPASESPHPS